jgi:hypothetical protein
MNGIGAHTGQTYIQTFIFIYIDVQHTVEITGIRRYKLKTKAISVVRVREQTVPTERLRLVGEVSVNFWG